MKTTPAVIRALQAVERGAVVNTFTAKGNVFKVPKGVSPRVCRDLHLERWIEDVPGQKGGGAFASHFTQRLTPAGRAALSAARQPEGGGA